MPKGSNDDTNEVDLKVQFLLAIQKITTTTKTCGPSRHDDDEDEDEDSDGDDNDDDDGGG